MKIYSVNDKEFAAYGKVHSGYDVSDLLSALDKHTVTRRCRICSERGA